MRISISMLIPLCALISASAALADGGSCIPTHIPVCDSQVDRPAPPGDLDGLSDFRKAVVAAAASQIGAVSDERGTDCNKVGWENLRDYFQTSMMTSLNSYQLEILKRPFTEPGVVTKLGEWCGIFALWAVKTGAMGTLLDPDNLASGPPPQPARGNPADYRGQYLYFARWLSYGGSNGNIVGLPLRRGSDGILPGDIVVFRGRLNHHAIVERVLGDTIYTIDGNQMCQMVARQARDLGEVAGYYPIE